MALASLFEERLFRAAQRQLADRAARVEMAAGRRTDRARHVALQHDALALRVGSGIGTADSSASV